MKANQSKIAKRLLRKSIHGGGCFRGDPQFKVLCPRRGLERDMRTPAERYGKSMTEVGVLEELDGAIREAIQHVDIKVLRAFLQDALSTVL